MSQALTGDVIRDQLLPMVSVLAADPIPNIRFNIAKSLSTIIPLLKKANLQPVLSEKVKPILVKMQDDGDVDVRYYSQVALALV